MAALLMAGCGGGGDDESATSTTVADTTDPPTTTEPTTTTTEPRTPEEEVEEAYWEAAAVLDDVLLRPDPGDERLSQVMDDPLLTHLVEYLGDLQEEGVATSWVDDEPPPREVVSIEVNGDIASMVVCEIDNPLTVRVKTEEVVDDSVSSALVEITLARVDEVWRVSDSVSTAEWDDGLGCDR